MSTAKTYSAKTATAVIIANMVGTGVFTALGFQLANIQSGFILIMLWAIGGLIALCGAMSYAELGAAMPRSGGEYNFLSRIYHPAAGFVSGWISASIGFAAPIAAIALAFAAYATSGMGEVSPLVTKGIACGLVLVITAIHATHRKASAGFQTSFTLLKILFVLAFAIGALIMVPQPQPISFLPQAGDFTPATFSAFFVALIYVSYSYTGWNAATYLSSELENPQKSLPRILLTGTAIVTVLYVLLNYMFLKTAPISAMTSTGEEIKVGYIAAKYAFGDGVGRVFGYSIAVLLISSVSAMTLAGPRALQVIGEDFKSLSLLGKTNANGLPYIAIILQSVIALLLILTSSFSFIVKFAGAMLALNSFLAVLGVFILRWREPDLERPYKTFLYPVVPLIYLVLTFFTLVFVVIDGPSKALFAGIIIGSGLVLYALSRNKD